MNTPEHIIIAYLDGELSAAERSSFEEELASNKELATAVEQQRSLKKMLATYQSEKSDREEIAAIYNQIKTPAESTVKKFPSKQIVWMLAAAAIALLLWVAWPGGNSGSISQEKLFSSVFQPAPAPEKMGLEGDGQQALSNGHTAYSEKKYAVAITQYEIAMEDSSLRSEAAFFLSQSYLANHQYAEAASNLKLVKNRSQEVRWYSALAALGQGDTATTRQLLLPLIAEPSYDFHKEAKELVGQLGKVEL